MSDVSLMKICRFYGLDPKEGTQKRQDPCTIV